MAGSIVSKHAPAPQCLTRLKECRYGKMLYLHRDEYVGKSLDTYGEYSEGEANLFQQILHPGAVVIEAGANIGAHTVRLAQLVEPSGLVLAFEPQRAIFHLLCANLALNDIFNVHTYLAAVGSRDGTVKIPPIDYSATANFGGLPMDGCQAGETVPVTTLDGFKLPSLRLLKVDVEGMETEVLQGAHNLIARHRPLLYVENDREENSERLISLIESMDYVMWWHLCMMYNPHNYAGNTDNVFGNTVSSNLLAVPREMPINIEGLRKVTGPADFWKSR